MVDASKPVQGQHADLVAFEMAVYCRKHPADDAGRIEENDKAVKAMHQCLVALREGAHFVGEEILSTASMTRFCSAVVALFSDHRFKLTDAGFGHVLAERSAMETVFKASVYNGSDFVFSMIPNDAEDARKYLALFSVNSKLNTDLETIFRNDPQGTFGLYLSLIGYGQVFTKEGHERREKLLEMCDIFKDVAIEQYYFNVVCSAYMHCSYASSPMKHDIKRMFHHMIRKILAPLETVNPVTRSVRKDRPRLLIIFEWWWSKHAMYRSYARSIQQLKKDFYLIGCCAGKNTDEEARAIFDEWVSIDGENMVLDEVVGKMFSLKPDIVYYPSIGMAIWVIAMASLRIAPVQVMSYGHPATSNSPMIDYGVIESDCLVEKCFSEHMIGLPPNTVRPSAYQPVEQKHVARKTDVVRIGVAAMQVKVSWPFVQAMQEVSRRAKKKVEIYFFAAAYGVGLYSMARDMGALLPNSIVQEKQDYSAYVESLHQMDIILFSFPFGGANSAYDALTVGVPMVSLEGEQPHSRSDASIIRRAGLPESLIAHSPAEYVEAVLRLMDDDERSRIAAMVRAVDVEKSFYASDDSGAFLDAFKKIYLDNCLEMAA